MRKFFSMLTIMMLALSLHPSGNLAIAQDAGVVVADGLNGPMGVLMDESGTLWVIESGTGGDTDTPFVDPQSGETITAKYGETARVITIAPDGTEKVMTALPSIATGADIIGGARLATLGGKVYATVGQWLGDPTAEAGLPNMAVVAEIQDGSATAVASTWDFERKENPDGLATDSHPYGLAASAEGVLWVTDAGGNALLRVNPLTGRVRLVTVFEGIPAPFPNPARNNENLTDPVPTGVVGKEGMVFVSLLSGFPFTPGSAKVVTVADDGTVSDYATGLTMLTDLQLGPDNELYAVQFAEFGENGPTPNSGALVRIAQGEGSTPILSGLSFPTAVTFNATGDAYLTINAVGAPGSGQVVMYSGIAGAASVEAAGTSNVTPSQTATETATLTDTVAMTDTLAMTDTATVTDTAAMTDTQAMTDTVTMTDTMAMTDTAAVTYTVATTDSAAMTDTTSIASEIVVPNVVASDQESDGATVVVDQVVAAEQGWIVIHSDDAGKPGPVLGQTSVPAGTTDNIVVVLDTALSGENKLWAMLHIDAGVVGTYEFPGADGPVIINSAITMTPFTATTAAADAASAPIVKEPDAADATRNTEQAREPETMPVTGASLSDVSPTTLPVVTLILLGLMIGAVVTRRRQA